MLLRKEFVSLATQEGANIAALCRKFQISRKTAYKWLTRGTEGCADLSRRPHSSPSKTKDAAIERVLKLKAQYPYWGARKLKAVLDRQGDEEAPSFRVVHKILKQNGFVKPNPKLESYYHRFEHEAPNRLWQMDFKGHFAYEAGRCHPLTILDDHSRFSVCLKACENEKRETVHRVLVDIFRQYGLPERINVDNGQPWGSLFECARYTTLSIWLIRLGIKVSYSKPRHPQTNGKDERFHRTLKEELINNRYFRNLEHIQSSFDQWRYIYNLERPHQAINMQVPASRYRPSYRSYPDVLNEFAYANDYLLRKVDTRGRIFIENRQIFIGVPFAKEAVGIRPCVEDGVFDIYFCHQKLGQIDLKKISKKTITNLYSQRTTEL